MGYLMSIPNMSLLSIMLTVAHLGALFFMGTAGRQKLDDSQTNPVNPASETTVDDVDPARPNLYHTTIICMVLL